jgi:hypothetical protein
MRLLSFFNAAGLCAIAIALVVLVTAPVDSKFVALLAGGAGLVMFLIAHSARGHRGR